MCNYIFTYLSTVIFLLVKLIWRYRRDLRDYCTQFYNPDTGVFGSADETYISDLKSDGRKKQKILLDFGDSFFLDSLIKSIGYDTVLNTLPYSTRIHSVPWCSIICSATVPMTMQRSGMRATLRASCTRRQT